MRARRTALGIGVSVLALLVLLLGIQYAPVVEALQSAKLAYLAFPVVWLPTSFSVMALRWK